MLTVVRKAPLLDYLSQSKSQTLRRNIMNKHNFKLLIVDDDPDYTKVLRKILSTEDYLIQTANSGEDALFKSSTVSLRFSSF